MKTHAPNAKPATAPRALEIQPFTVTTEWVSVTTSILARHAERMQTVPSYQKNRLRYCGELLTNYQNAKLFNDNRGLEMECLTHGHVTGRRTSRITFAIEAGRWAQIVDLCERINTTPTAFIRAAIAYAAEGWERFDQQQRTA